MNIISFCARLHPNSILSKNDYRGRIIKIATRSLSVSRNNFNIKGTRLDNGSGTVQVEFHDGATHQFPWLFLQDNCTCPACYHPSSQSRLRKLTDLKLENRVDSVKVAENGSSIECIWKDGHKGVFSEEWLRDRRFTDENTKARKRVARSDPELVGADLVFPRDNFQRILSDDASLLAMLETLSRKGVFMLEGAPHQVGQLKKLGERVGFIRTTHYGHEFTVKSEPNAVNLAYTSDRLGVHTDLPYYAYPPGVQLLHCIKQYAGEDGGGESHLVDGFRVAHQMKEDFPEQFRILCDTPLEFYDIGKDYTTFFKVHHSPSFVLHPENGSLVRVLYSNQVLSSYLPIPLEKARPLYEALKLFTDLCYKRDNLIVFKLREGEVLLFDNWRLLHGREGFDPSKGQRHLEGCYIDWDEVFSRINVIKNEGRS